MVYTPPTHRWSGVMTVIITCKHLHLLVEQQGHRAGVYQAEAPVLCHCCRATQSQREREREIRPLTVLQGRNLNLIHLSPLTLFSSSASCIPPSQSDITAPPLTDGEEADLLAVLSRQVFTRDFSLPPSPPLTNSSARPWPRAAPDFLFPPPLTPQPL